MHLTLKDRPKLCIRSWVPPFLPTVKVPNDRFLETGLLPAINADKLQVLLGVAHILLPIPFLHDGF